MPNDDGLERLIASPETLREYIPALQAEAERAKQLQEKITAMEHGMKFYIDRNIQLAEQYQDMKRSLECWVTRAGSLEAKLRRADEEQKESIAYVQSADRSIDDLVDVNQEMNGLLWWLTAEAWRDVSESPSEQDYEMAMDRLLSNLRQMLATQGYTREGLEKR